MDAMDGLMAFAVLSLIAVILGTLVWYVTTLDRSERRIQEYLTKHGAESLEISMDHNEPALRMFYVSYRDVSGQLHKGMCKVRNASSIDGLYWMSGDPATLGKAEDRPEAGAIAEPLLMTQAINTNRIAVPIADLASQVSELQREVDALRSEVAILKSKFEA